MRGACYCTGQSRRRTGLPFGWLGVPPSINRLIGLEWLPALLYPGQPKRDLAADVRAFHRSYYQVVLTDAQVQALPARKIFLSKDHNACPAIT